MSNKPTHTAYSVREFTKTTGEADSSWSKVGVGFIHKDGKGFNIVLDSLPLNGRIVLRLNEKKKEAEE